MSTLLPGDWVEAKERENAYEELMKERMKDFRKFNKKLKHLVDKVPEMKRKLMILKENMKKIEEIFNFFS